MWDAAAPVFSVQVTVTSMLPSASGSTFALFGVNLILPSLRYSIVPLFGGENVNNRI